MRKIRGGVTKIRELHSIGIYLPTVDEAMAEGLRIYEENTGVFYAMQGLGVNEQRKQDYRAISEYWQITYEVRPDGVVVRREGDDDIVITGVGEPIASAGGNVSGIENVDTNYGGEENRFDPDTQRRLWRAIDKWQKLRGQGEEGGYAAPVIRRYKSDVEGQENIQRQRWIEGVDKVMGEIARDIPEEYKEEPQGPEKDPRKPDVDWMKGETQALGPIIDIIVAGIRIQRKLSIENELSKLPNVDPELPVVVIFLGSNQDREKIDTSWVEDKKVKDNEIPAYAPSSDTPGLNALAARLKNEGHQVVVFETGSNPTDLPPRVGDVDDKKEIAIEWFNRNYSNAANPAGIISIDYSWGTSLASEVISKAISDINSQIPVLGSVNVDGISLKGVLPHIAELPYTQRHLDIYQDSSFIGGNTVRHTNSNTIYEHVYVPGANHVSIDNDPDVLFRIFNFVNDILDDQYE